MAVRGSAHEGQLLLRGHMLEKPMDHAISECRGVDALFDR